MVPRKVHVELRSKVSPTIFDPRAAEEIGASYELRLGEDRSRAEVAEGRFEVVLGAADRPDATIECPATLVALVYDTDEPVPPAVTLPSRPSNRRTEFGTLNIDQYGQSLDRGNHPVEHAPDLYRRYPFQL